LFLVGVLGILAGLYLVSLPLMLVLGGSGFVAAAMVLAAREPGPAQDVTETDQQ
jgi:hypothetical protein